MFSCRRERGLTPGPGARAGVWPRSGRVRWALGGRARLLSPQFQTELRKILLSLIEVAQKLLALSPGAVELFTQANGTRQAGRRGPASGPRLPASAVLPLLHLLSAPGRPGRVRGCAIVPVRVAGAGGHLRLSEVRVAASVRCPDEVLRPGPAWASPVPCLARSDAGRGRGRAGGRDGPAAAHGDGLPRGQGREGPPAEPVRRAIPAGARGLVPWGSPQVTCSCPQLRWTLGLREWFRGVLSTHVLAVTGWASPCLARFGVAHPSGNGT